MKHFFNSIDSKIYLLLIMLFCAIGLTFPVELTHESWGYWMFASDLSHGFILADRSPLYSVYLHLFTLLPYPLSIAVETFVSLVFITIVLFTFFKSFFGRLFSFFGTVIWIPFFIISEPYVQKLGLGFLLISFIIRLAYSGKWKFPLIYLFLVLAYLMRPVYMFPLGLSILTDLYQLFKQRHATNHTKKFNFRFLILLVPIVLQVFFITHKSPSKWNDAWFTSRQWFPGSNSLSDISFIQHFSWDYIPQKYGSFENADFYFTHKEVFGDAKTFFQCVARQPLLVSKFFAHNMYRFVLTSPTSPTANSAGKLFYLNFVAFILCYYGLYRFWRNNKSSGYFILCLLSASLVTILSYPKVQYMYTLLPLVIFSISFYVGYLNDKVRVAGFRNLSIAALFIIMLYLPVRSWAVGLYNDVKDVRNIKVLTVSTSPYVRGQSIFKTVLDTCHCKGIMTNEYDYFTAFYRSRQVFYDLFEIPPFGALNNSVYHGLQPQRINCLLISNSTAHEIGWGTNVHIRYKNYVLPYQKYLQKNGAVTTVIPNYGILISLSNSVNKR